MTQSGQGEEPSARPAREGIVLPSDGGQPLLPGTAGGAAGPAYGRPDGQAAPPAGQAWGRPWGPDDAQTPAPQPGQSWPGAPAQPARSWGSGSPEPYPRTPPTQWDAHGPAGGNTAHPGAGPLPPEGAPAPAHGAEGGAPLPPAGNPYAHPAGQHAYSTGAHAGPAHSAPPPDPYGPPGGQHGAHGQGAYGAAGHSAPAPGAGEGATQYLPPVAAAPADEGATQYIPPVAGALPPEAPGDASTRYLGRVPQAGAGPLPPAGPGGDPDAQATQFMAPLSAQADGAGGRQTYAEFDNLFRSDAGGDAPATQQLPRFQQPHDVPPGRPFHPGPGGPGGPSFDGPAGDDDPARGGRRGGSRVTLIAAVGVGIAVLGIGAGALLSGGDGGDGGDKGDKNANVSATAPAGDTSASPAADPARAQAVELDKLLADSGSSRASVINAVADVRTCDNLGKAASDLNAAARQRNELVTRLGRLSVDKLPDHAELTSALTNAWRASASADQHYAAWAHQVGGKKGCKKGHARTTAETQQGNRQSGVASGQKTKAAQLWNAIARKYGLTQRQPTQL